MVLAKILRRSAPKLRSQQLVAVVELDKLLDVDSDAFGSNIKKLAKSFAKAQATLDLKSFRDERSEAVMVAGSPDMPDIRDALYSADLKRMPQMDREEEFRMARRHEFLHGLLSWALSAHGMEPSTLSDLLKRPAGQIREAIEAQPDVKEVARDWLLAMVSQFEELRNLYVEGALYIVLTTVNRYRNLGVESQDLIQEGNASLFQAIDGFDWRRDVRFRTYAQYWVHQAVLQMLYNRSRTVRVPSWVQKILGKIRRAQEAGRRRALPEGRAAHPDDLGPGAAEAAAKRDQTVRIEAGAMRERQEQ